MDLFFGHSITLHNSHGLRPFRVVAEGSVCVCACEESGTPWEDQRKMGGTMAGRRGRLGGVGLRRGPRNTLSVIDPDTHHI